MENNPVLKGIRMSKEKAEWLSSVSAYVQEQELIGREVILYGNIPALSYYLQMPYAFSPWSDLRSYSIETMRSELEGLEDIADKRDSMRPVVILENGWAMYYEQGKANGSDKFMLLTDYMMELNYRETFRNDKFVIYE